MQRCSDDTIRDNHKEQIPAPSPCTILDNQSGDLGLKYQQGFLHELFTSVAGCKCAKQYNISISISHYAFKLICNQIFIFSRLVQGPVIGAYFITSLVKQLRARSSPYKIFLIQHTTTGEVFAGARANSSIIIGHTSTVHLSQESVNSVQCE